ncbi:S8/S53 family peptidase [Amycolatopsis sp. NPDC004625]|uniref:S8 family peptidase n=1 Tax=Amycolatopsis sp. NPDC004625 TaxID=3154670 RepID=UPI0033A4DB7D
MCDFVPGEIMVGYPVDGPGRMIFEEILESARVGRSLLERDEIIMPMGDELPMAFRRVATLPGGEQAAVDDINRLTFEATVRLAQRYHPKSLLDPRQRVFAQPMHFLRPCHGNAGFGSAQPFRLTPTHFHYLYQIGHPNPRASEVRPTVAIIDGGLDVRLCPEDPFHGSVPPAVNLADSSDTSLGQPDAATTHGTLVAKLINEVCPEATLLPLRIIGGDGVDNNAVATEWALFRAVKEAIEAGADIINLSMRFGINTTKCPTCGDLPREVRTPGFELVVQHAAGSPGRIVVVAAAGNQGIGQLAFPSRFASTVAVSAVNSSLQHSYVTNFDHTGRHPLLFAAPGGDRGGDADEAVAESDDWRYHGTSFAAAYATGTLATIMSLHNVPAGQAVEILNQTSRTAFAGFDPEYHGRGVIRIV